MADVCNRKTAPPWAIELIEEVRCQNTVPVWAIELIQEVKRLAHVLQLRPAHTAQVATALNQLRSLTNQEGVLTMSSPTPQDLVSVSQAWLDGVGQSVESAVSVLTPYIQQLLAGQSVQLNPADQTQVEKALADLGSIEPSSAPVTPEPTPAPEPTPEPGV